TDKYIDRGDEGTQILSAADQFASWKQNQDYLASLTPAQRVIEAAKTTVSTEGGIETGYDPVTFNGKDWTVTAGGNSLMRLADDQSGLGPKQYRYEELDAATGQIRQGIGVEGPGLLKGFLTNPVTGLILGLALPGVGQAIGSALGATGAAAAALGSGVLNFGLQVATGRDPIDALKSAVLSAGAGFVSTQVGSMLPAELASAGKNAVTQLITTGKLDPAALATSVGSSFATDALASQTGMDRATASKLVNAGIQAFKGNELAAVTSLAQAGFQSGLSGTKVTAQSPQDRAAFLEANSPIQGSEVFIAAKQAGLNDVDALDAANAMTSGAVTLPVKLSTVGGGQDISTTPRDTQYDPDLVDAARGQALATKLGEAQTAIKMGAGEFTGAAETTAGAGEFAGSAASRAASEKISNAKTFNEAFAAAREAFGPGATFNWGGKLYSTATAAERPDLAATNIAASTSTATQDFGVPFIAENGMHNRAAFIQAGGGTSDADYAKYVNAVNALIAEGKSGTLIKPSSVNSAGKDLPPTTGEVTMEKPRVDSVLGSIAAQGVASYGANTIAGVLSSLGFTDAGKTVMNKATAIANAATEAEGADITKGKKAIDDALSQVGDSTDFRSFASNMGNLVSTVYNNPKAFGATVGSEFVEEVLQIASIKGLPVGFATKEALASALENGGAAYNTEYASQIKQGASQEVAHDKAQKAAGVAAGTTVALMGAAAGAGKVIGAISGKADDVVAGPLATTKQVAKTTGKESIQEAIEEGSISTAVDLALRGSVDVKNMLTNMTGGALYGGPTSGVMQATSADKLDPAALSENTSTQIQQTVNSGVDLSQAGTSVIASSLQTGLSNNQSVDTLVPSIITGALDANVDSATVVSSIIDTGIKSGADTPSLVTATVTASLNNGLDASTVVSSTITGALNNGTDPSTVIGPTVTSALSSGADPSTVISSTVTSALNTGSDTATVVDLTVTSALNNGANSSTVINDAVTAAITTSANNGGNINATATSAVASSVASAVKTGVDSNIAIESATQAATKSGSSVDVNTSTKGDITVTTATTSDSTTKVVVDTNNQTTTTQTKSGTDTTTTVDTATSTIKTTSDGNTQIITETDKTTNITTTTTTDVNTGISTVTTNTNINFPKVPVSP
ncbi:MAG: hypothetical protein EBR82_51515, partial [Caulobacteraceae bacterium]|nr:hypothetical protein [Caulobacteraceae bacterium]